ncbi:hypothetical protein [Streptomyces sp. NBC_00236]|uniref:hypothetical protein n=1 Tax=Streptomyces sp. NBC_00236 TaxID=2903639 RepID=UPI002E281F8E|nr:hypothetical protein [Streptomyces sp. NBC_00236]
MRIGRRDRGPQPGGVVPLHPTCRTCAPGTGPPAGSSAAAGATHQHGEPPPRTAADATAVPRARSCSTARASGAPPTHDRLPARATGWSA